MINGIENSDRTNKKLIHTNITQLGATFHLSALNVNLDNL